MAIFIRVVSDNLFLSLVFIVFMAEELHFTEASRQSRIK